MKLRPLSVLLVGIISTNATTPPTLQAAVSPEQKCFQLLETAAASDPEFDHLDLSKVTKISGKNGAYESGEFSVKTWDDFQNTWSRPIPVFASDIVEYPNNLGVIAERNKIKRKIHKANRNNSASVIYANGVKTKIDHWMSKNGSNTGQDIQDYFAGVKNASELDSKHYRQKIDGYYIDSRYVTFGKESELELSFPSRAANPDNDGFYPVGRPVKDMREYIMYTHHLSSDKGGDFVSCELFKVSPRNGFKLKDYDYTGKGINWLNYGGSKMSQTDVTVKNVGGGQYKQMNITYSISNRQDPNKIMMRQYGIAISYDNGSSFFNPFVTVGLFDDSVKDAKNGSKTFREMREDYYSRILASGLGIGDNANPSAPQIVTDQFSSYDIARNNAVTIKDGSQVTYYTNDQDTADKVCEDLGYDRGGEWAGGLQTATAPGWSYGNLSIAGWDGSNAYVLCRGGSACISQSEQYRGQLKCSKTQ